ncbi:MAG: hypothetical protein PHT30_04110 [Bacilli bacterium]|nr:hypothetical protein [Bacilli bacterium]
MKIIRMATFLIYVSSMALPVFAGWFGPSNYDECILESMKGVTSDKAAILIESICRKKFLEKPEKDHESRDLSYKELSNLTGRAGYDPANVNLFLGNIYNGNSNVTVSEITLGVTTTMDGKKVTRMYTHKVIIEPQTTAHFGFPIIVGDNGADYSWNVASSKGY